MRTNSRDRLTVVVLLAAIAVLHVLRFGGPQLGDAIGLSDLGFTIFGQFVVTLLCAITLWELSGRERRRQWPAAGVG